MPLFLLVELNPFAAQEFDLLRALQAAQCVRSVHNPEPLEAHYGGHYAGPHYAGPHYAGPFAEPLASLHASSLAPPESYSSSPQAGRLNELERQLGRVIDELRSLQRQQTTVVASLAAQHSHLMAHGVRLSGHDSQHRNAVSVSAVENLASALAALGKDVAALKSQCVTQCVNGKPVNHAVNHAGNNGQSKVQFPGSGTPPAGPLDIQNH